MLVMKVAFKEPEGFGETERAIPGNREMQILARSNSISDLTTLSFFLTLPLDGIILMPLSVKTHCQMLTNSVTF